jgi:hypothetical protein
MPTFEELQQHPPSYFSNWPQVLRKPVPQSFYSYRFY